MHFLKIYFCIFQNKFSWKKN